MNDISKEEKSKYVFHQLIEKEGDYIGMIAYGLYKKNKIDYIIDFKNKNNGQKPTSNDLSTFQNNHCVDGQLKMYRQTAESLTTQFYNILFDKQNQKLDKRNKELQQLDNELKEKEKQIKERERAVNLREKHCNMKPKNSYWIGVSQSVVASFIFIVLTILIIYYIDNNIDIIKTLRDLWKTK